MFIPLENQTVKWRNQVNRKSGLWLHHITDCLNSTPIPVIVVKFENLKSKLYEELQKILDFLKYSYKEEDLECTVNHKSDSFHRKHNGTIDPYSSEQKQKILNSIQEANKILSQYNIAY